MHVQAWTCRVKQAESILCDCGCLMSTTSKEMSSAITEWNAVPHTHKHKQLCMNSQVSLNTWPCLFLSHLLKK